jgi:sialidase-1
MNYTQILNKFCGSLLLSLAISASAAGVQFSDVFITGKDQFPSIRIPSVVMTEKGTLLAFAEGRAFASDQANNKIILKRSADGGKTWSALQIIADDGKNCLNNPCAVVDQKSARIILMFQSYPFGFSERDGKILPGLEGTAIVRNYVITSDDDGVTWSKIRDVTRTTKNAVHVTTLASGPGLGIQLQRGAHKNRIIIPFNEGPFGQWNVRAVFSDDDGTNWQTGEPAPGGCVTNAAGKILSRVNEVQMVELADGSVILNSRQSDGRPLRKIAVSRDGGATWSRIGEEPALRDPGCMASIFRYTFPGKDGKSCLLYSGPDSGRRRNGTIHISYDDGKTWPVKKVLLPGSFGYSALTELTGGTIGCLFETDGATRIVFAQFPMAWLENTVK